MFCLGPSGIHLHPVIYHTDLAYIDTMEKIVDCGLFVQFQFFVEKTMSPSGIPPFLIDYRATQAV